MQNSEYTAFKIMCYLASEKHLLVIGYNKETIFKR